MQGPINYSDNLNKLRDLMLKNGVKSYIIPNADPHNSEEPCEKYARVRNQFSSYHAPAGTMLVTLDNSYVYTDGRFWTAAEIALKDSPTILMKAGKEGVLPMEEFISKNKLYPVGMDFSLFTPSYLNSLKLYHLDDKIVDFSLDCLICEDHKESINKIFKLDQKILSTTFEERISEIRRYLVENNYDAFLISSLDEVAHVLGYRGNDILYAPVFYSYLLVFKDEVYLFIDERKLPADFSLKNDIKIRKYEDIYSFLSARDELIAYDNNSANLKILSCLKHKKGVFSPVCLSKAIKGPVEISNILKYHVNDGYYVLKLMKYIEDNKNRELTEYDYAKYLDDQRLSDSDCFELSFQTIAAVDTNATMMHYAPDEKTFSKVKRDNHLLLVDSGGQYYGATTDITRTFMIGKPTSEIIHDYTLTLKSQIALSTSIFMKNSSGHTLDIKAREVMWKEGLDYKCGTGHGVGYILNVHEGPIGFRYYIRPGVYDMGTLIPGQVITVEPGVYKENKYGIRLENELLVTEYSQTEQGIFYSFKTITYCPYDVRLIDKTMLDEDEIRWLNSYHQDVYDKLSKFIIDRNEDDVLVYLKEVTKPI